MKYVVFGSGGFAKEVISYLISDGHIIEAVVSTLPFNNEKYNNFNLVSKLSPGEYPDSEFIMAVGDIAIKKIFVEQNEDRWATFIHSTAFVSPFAKIGKGCIVCPFTSVLGDAIVEEFVTLNVYTTVAHDNVVKKYTTYSPYTGTMGNCEIGEECFLGTAAYCIPKVKLPSGTKVSAGAVVRKSVAESCTLYGDPAAPRQK